MGKKNEYPSREILTISLRATGFTVGTSS